MIATNVNFHNREIKSSMPYFGVFTRMFVHFHLHTTHDAVHDSLRDLNFSLSLLYDILQCMATLHYHLFQYTKLIYCFKMHIDCI